MVNAAPSPTERKRIARELAEKAPLSFVAGTRALSSWLDETGDTLTLLSGTGRDVSLYLGPGRRYFGNPDDPLRLGRGRVALIIDRALLKINDASSDWKFAPFDVGEVLYHWNQRALPQEYLAGYTPEKLRHSLRSLDTLTAYLTQVLDECYEDPWDYFKPGQKPRPSLGIDDLTAAVYRASTDRWFGRVRSFSGALTFEIRSPSTIRVPKELILAVVVLDDQLTREVVDKSRLIAEFGDRLRITPTPETVMHPDLPSVLIESETTLLVLKHMENIIYEKT